MISRLNLVRQMLFAPLKAMRVFYYAWSCHRSDCLYGCMAQIPSNCT